MSAPKTARASAPGKLMVGGEYAVLDGAPSLVMAVDARVMATLRPSPGEAPIGPEARAALELAEARYGATGLSLALDASALRRGEAKLGLGSSAAGAAAAVGAVMAAHGADPGSPAERERVFALALEGHRAVAPEGSGADVAAAVYGGLLRFDRDPAHPDAPRIAPLSFPEGLIAKVIFTGKPARTSDLVAKVNALKVAESDRYQEAMGVLFEAAAAMVEAFEANDPDAVVRSAGAYGEAMERLGRAARAPIVEERLATLMALARSHGGRAKPSGAGGGDVVIAFFVDEKGARGFVDACAESGFEEVALALAAPGLRAEPTS